MFLPVSLWPFLTSCSHLSLATEQLDGLRGVLEWEVLLVINCSRAAGWFVGSAGMGGFVQNACDLACYE